jgi:predicted transcriptional regulator
MSLLERRPSPFPWIFKNYVEKPVSSSGGKPIKYYRLTKNVLNALKVLKRQNELMWESFKVPAYGEKSSS